MSLTQVKRYDFGAPGDIPSWLLPVYVAGGPIVGAGWLEAYNALHGGAEALTDTARAEANATAAGVQARVDAEIAERIGASTPALEEAARRAAAAGAPAVGDAAGAAVRRELWNGALTVLAVGLLAGGGWYLWKNRRSWR